mgnify:CR=1 FL=1
MSIVALLMMLLSGTALAFPNRNEDCSKCHSLKKEEAESLLKIFNRNISVIAVGRSTVRYLWEVSYESEGKKGLIYLDMPKKHILSGTLLDVQSKKNLTQERLSEINRVNVSQIPLKDALVIGDKNAKQRVIVFTDPECPFCGKLHDAAKKIVSERKDIAFYVKMFPLKMHPGAYDKAKSIVCEKSLKLLDDAFEKKPIPAPKCTTSVIDENIKLAEKLGISGTPALIMPDGRVVAGFQNAESLKNLIDKK